MADDGEDGNGMWDKYFKKCQDVSFSKVQVCSKIVTFKFCNRFAAV